MVRKIVGGVLAVLMTALTPASASAIEMLRLPALCRSACTAPVAPARLGTAGARDQQPLRQWEGLEGLPAHTDTRVALEGLEVGLADWMTALLAAIGMAIVWLLVSRGPFV